MWCAYAGLGWTIRLLDLLGHELTAQHAAGLQVLDVIIFLIRQSVKLYRMSWIYEHLSVGVTSHKGFSDRENFEEHSSLQ